MEASECHFLIGMCHIELKGYHEAKDAFTSAVKINPNYAQVWHKNTLQIKNYISTCSKKHGMQNFIFCILVYWQALYQRGVAKMKLSSRGLSREGIQDFNRALAINPRIFQVSKKKKVIFNIIASTTSCCTYLQCLIFNQSIKLVTNCSDKCHKIKAFCALRMLIW